MEDVLAYVTDLYNETYARIYHAFRFQLTCYQIRHAQKYNNIRIYRNVSAVEYERTPRRHNPGSLIDLITWAACDSHKDHDSNRGRYHDYYILRDVTDRSNVYKKVTMPTCVALTCPRCYPNYRQRPRFAENQSQPTKTPISISSCVWSCKRHTLINQKTRTATCFGAAGPCGSRKVPLRLVHT